MFSRQPEEKHNTDNKVAEDNSPTPIAFTNPSISGFFTRSLSGNWTFTPNSDGHAGSLRVSPKAETYQPTTPQMKNY